VKQAIKAVDGAEIATLNDISRKHWENWTRQMGPPVPVIIDPKVWYIVLQAALSTTDPVNNPRVFRLFMKRGNPRHVVHASEIEEVWTSEQGAIRWSEGGYPSVSEPTRKGGNAFVQGDVQIQLGDAWWMGREQTDLRILLAKKANTILVSAWWARAGGRRGSPGRNDTDGALWPVLLLVGQ